MAPLVGLLWLVPAMAMPWTEAVERIVGRGLLVPGSQLRLERRLDGRVLVGRFDPRRRTFVGMGRVSRKGVDWTRWAIDLEGNDRRQAQDVVAALRHVLPRGAALHLTVADDLVYLQSSSDRWKGHFLEFDRDGKLTRHSEVSECFAMAGEIVWPTGPQLQRQPSYVPSPWEWPMKSDRAGTSHPASTGTSG